MYKDCKVLMLSLGVCWWNKVITKMLSSSLYSIIIIFFNQPFKLKFLLGRHLATNSFGLGRLFFNNSSRKLQNFRRHGNQHGRNLKSCQLFLPYCFRSFVLSSALFLHSDLFRFLLFSGVFFLIVSQIAVFLKCPRLCLL